MTRAKLAAFRPRSAFTLIEVLIVILVIIILAALLLPAIQGAFRQAKLTQQIDDMSRLTAALEAFKNRYGVYPPSRIRLREGTRYNQAEGFDAHSAKWLKRIWPTLRLQTETVAVGANTAIPSTGNIATTTRFLWCVDQPNKDATEANWTGVYELEGDECLVFFLGGIPQFDRNNPNSVIILHGFSKRANDPSGVPNGNIPATVNRDLPLMEFEGKRLHVRVGGDEVRLPTGGAPPGAPVQFDNGTLGPNAPERAHTFPNAQITQYLNNGLKLPSYFSTGQDDFSLRRPWAYFSGYDSQGYRPGDFDLPTTGGAGWFEALDERSAPSTFSGAGFEFQLRYLAPSGGQLCRAESPAPNPYSDGPPDPNLGNPTGGILVRWHNASTYQLISTGSDGKYGPGGMLPRNPEASPQPDMTNSGTSYDNVTNVSGSAKLGDFNRQQLNKN